MSAASPTQKPSEQAELLALPWLSATLVRVSDALENERADPCFWNIELSRKDPYRRLSLETFYTTDHHLSDVRAPHGLL